MDSYPFLLEILPHGFVDGGIAGIDVFTNEALLAQAVGLWRA